MPALVANSSCSPLRRARLAAACAFALFSAASAAHADEPRFSVHGFGTLGATYHDASGVEYRRDPSQARGATAGEVSFDTASRLGLQLNVRLASAWEVMVQGESKLNPDNNWKPDINWAVLKYSPADWITLRAGRLNFDPYVGGDSRDIGYTWLTVRPPLEVYGAMDAQRYDGGDLLMRFPLGPGLLEAKFYRGEMADTESVATRNFRVRLDGSDLVGGHLDYSTEIWSVRLGMSQTTVASPENTWAPIITLLNSYGTQQTRTIANMLDVDGRKISNGTLSATYRPGPFQAELIYAHAWTEAPALPLGERAALTLGYRFGHFTPYAAVSAVKTDRTMYRTGLPSSLNPRIAALNAGIELAQTTAWDNQRSWALGVRYDVLSRLALKAQVDVVDVSNPSVIMGTGIPAEGRTFGVFGLSADFVF